MTRVFTAIGSRIEWSSILFTPASRGNKKGSRYMPSESSTALELPLRRLDLHWSNVVSLVVLAREVWHPATPVQTASVRASLNGNEPLTFISRIADARLPGSG